MKFQLEALEKLVIFIVVQVYGSSIIHAPLRTADVEGLLSTP